MYFLQTFHTIRQEQKQWEADNFGPPNPYHSTLGMIEETGELSHALLKRAQGIRGTSAEHDAAIIDALGDIGLYYISYLNAADYDTPPYEFILSTQDAESTVYEDISDLLHILSVIVRQKGEYRHADRFIACILYSLNALSCKLTGKVIVEHIASTWSNIVKKRDWRQNPQAGSVDPPADTKESPACLNCANREPSDDSLHAHIICATCSLNPALRDNHKPTAPAL